jgi:glycosyltransferase involved in cell wall biosynthesis
VIAQVFEPFSGGHHTKYVSFILPALVRLLEAGHLERVILTTTDRHRESRFFADSLARYESKVVFDVVAAGDIYHSGHKVSAMLLDSMVRNRPDYLVSTSADNGALTLALAALAGSPFSRCRASVGVMHYGSYEPAHAARDRLRDQLHRFARRFSPWSQIHVVNPLLYDFLREPGSRTASRVVLLPDPVETKPPVSKLQARERLQLPCDGTFLVVAGASNATKAIPELLAAFSAAALATDRRLLLAGSVHPPYRELIDRRYGDLVRQRRLITIDRYLSPDELHLANCAADVVAVPDCTGKLSSTLLAAIAARRPALADRRGYTGMILEKFGAGYGADLRDHGAFTAVLETAMRAGGGFVLPARANRLVAFHDPRNFVDTLLGPLYRQLGLAGNTPVAWEAL